MPLFHLKADLSRDVWLPWRYKTPEETDACTDTIILANSVAEALPVACSTGGQEPDEAWSGDNFTAYVVCETPPGPARLVMNSLGKIGGTV